MREITAEIRQTNDMIKKFAADVHSGAIRPPTAAKFTHVLSIGIGGSALGPMFVAERARPASRRQDED